MYSKKTDVMVINKKTASECNIYVDKTNLKPRQSLTYLSTLIKKKKMKEVLLLSQGADKNQVKNEISIDMA